MAPVGIEYAPEAPWRCPADCARYERRFADVNWSYGTLVTPPPPDEPPGLENGAAQLRDEAEDILNTVGPRVLAEVEAQRGTASAGSGRSPASWWRRLRRRR